MADEKTKDPDTAGSKPQHSENPTGETVPSEKREDSPFLGKLVTPQKPVDLREGAPPGGTSPKPPAPQQAPAPTPPPLPKTSQTPTPPKTLSSEDLLHGGNVFSLLEQEAERRGELPEAATQSTAHETPTQRGIREIGLQPRPEKIQKYEQEEKKKQQEQREQEGLPRIRTYASDMSEEIRKRGETLATIISAERDKMGRGPVGNEVAEKSEQPQQNQNALLIAGAGALVVVGIAAVIIAFMLTRSSAMPVQHTSMIPANDVAFIPTDNGTPFISILVAERKAATLSLGEVGELVLTAKEAPLPADTILTKLGAPNVLARNATNIMIGIHTFDKNQPFILIAVSAYDRAFEGMLAWEDTLALDLGAFFAPSRLQGDQIYATPPPMEFTDRVTQNVDVRESDATWPIIYAFPRRDLLLITTNESTLKEIMTRLTVQ